MSKFKNQANGELTEAYCLTAAKSVHTNTGEVMAAKGSWVVAGANNVISVIEDAQFQKEYKAIPLEKAPEPTSEPRPPEIK